MDVSNPPLNLSTESFSVSRHQKEKLNGHRSFSIWLTGLPAAGKSTIARHLEELLHSEGIRTLVLDGDNTRMGINKDLDFSTSGRKENIRRVAEIAKLLNEAGVVAIACFISPMKADREMAKQTIGDKSFIEVYVDAPLDVCIERDPKGLYKKAINGEISDFTGISAPYESPVDPQLTVATVNIAPAASAAQIMEWLLSNSVLIIERG